MVLWSCPTSTGLVVCRVQRSLAISVISSGEKLARPAAPDEVTIQALHCGCRWPRYRDSHFRFVAWLKTLAENRYALYTVIPYSIGAAMKWRVKLMRKAGRRIPWKILINESGLIGTITTHYCEYADQERYKVAALMCGLPQSSLELIEPQLLALGDQALILRGYERLVNDGGPFTVLQEWRCEPTL